MKPVNEIEFEIETISTKYDLNNFVNQALLLTDWSIADETLKMETICAVLEAFVHSGNKMLDYLLHLCI